MKVRFWKMSGAGNDFVLLSGFPKARSGAVLARALCDRRLGIGADGLLVMTRHHRKVRLDYWNSDGSAAFCGNGSRCAALWASAQAWVRGKKFKLQTNYGPLTACIAGKGLADVSMPAPKNLRLGRILKVGGRPRPVHYVDTGAPHAVIVVPNIEKINVRELGRPLRFHKAFGHTGANINFIEIHNDVLLIRTYERGVEDETLSCGTGVVASALIARVLGFGGAPMKVKVRSGDILAVSFDRGPRLKGPGKIVFTGEVGL